MQWPSVMVHFHRDSDHNVTPNSCPNTCATNVRLVDECLFAAACHSGAIDSQQNPYLLFSLKPAIGVRREVQSLVEPFGGERRNEGWDTWFVGGYRTLGDAVRLASECAHHCAAQAPFQQHPTPNTAEHPRISSIYTINR